MKLKPYYFEVAILIDEQDLNCSVNVEKNLRDSLGRTNPLIELSGYQGFVLKELEK